jgi:hypothetical protein
VKLISDIINELVDPSAPLSGALLKTKLLASRLDNTALLQWVNSELNGFSDVDETPYYRISTGDLVGNVLNGRMHLTNYAIPINHLSQKHYDAIRSVYIHDSIDALEDFTRHKSATMHITISAEVKSGLELSIRNLGNPYFQILSIHKVISASLFKNILSSVRSKLLDFMIAVEKEFGEEITIDTLRENNSIINNFMSTTIYNNGDGNINSLGDKAKINTTISIQKNNQMQLSEALKQQNVPPEDIDELLTIVDIEPATELNQFGQKVGLWIHKMLGKAVDGGWKIGIGAAGGILAEIINHYYGLK